MRLMRGLILALICAAPSAVSTADGVSVLSVPGVGGGGSSTIEGLGFKYYGPATASIDADAVWVSGKFLCDLPAAAGPSLAGMVVVSDGVLCHKIAMDLYAELDKQMHIAAYVQVSRSRRENALPNEHRRSERTTDHAFHVLLRPGHPGRRYPPPPTHPPSALQLSAVTCPRTHVYGRSLGWGMVAKGSMAMVSVPSKIEVATGVTTVAFLKDALPHWLPSAPAPAPAAVRVHLQVADPEARPPTPRKERPRRASALAQQPQSRLHHISAAAHLPIHTYVPTLAIARPLARPPIATRKAPGP